MSPLPPAEARPAAADPQFHARCAAEIDAVLREQLWRLRQRLLLHGLGAAIAIPCLLVLFFFGLDRSLRLPVPIRLFHTLLTAAALGAAWWWFVHRPRMLRLQDADVAVMLERVFPQLGQGLISAVQLKEALLRGELRNQSEAMIQALVTATATNARALPMERVFDGRRTGRLWLGAGAAMLTLGLGALLAPATAWAFVQRHLGFEVSYPKATRLVVEVPPAGADIQRQDDGAQTVLTLAGGADLHVSVLAEGTVPAEVFLRITGPDGEARDLGLTPRPGGRFRHVFRRLQGSFAFHAHGGDDDTGDRTVEVRTVLPPLVAEITAQLTPPAYTRKGVVTQRGGALEGLQGTTVVLDVTATAAVATAELVFLESGRRVPLASVAIADDSGRPQLLRGSFQIEQSDRYQVELTGESGLRSPNPGSYPIAALQDYAPVGRWLQPDDESGLLLLPEAVLPLRIEAQDDHGLVAATLLVETGAGSRTIDLLPTAAAAPEAAPPTRLQPVELYPVADLLGAAATAPTEPRTNAEGLSLSVELKDNRVPEPNATVLPKRHVQIVDQAQLAAAIARQFRGSREVVEQTLSLQRDRLERLEDLLPRLRSATPAEITQVLTSVEVGQGRVANAAERVHRQLMGAFDLHLWNRLEPATAAAEVLDLYQAFHRAAAEAQTHAPSFYRDLRQRRQKGTLGAMPTTLDPILAMLGLADALHTGLGPQALRLLTEAQVAQGTGGAAVEQTVQQAVQAQRSILQHLQDLLGRLDEWNEYQDLIQDLRALRDRQRDLQGRTDTLKGQ